MRLGRAVAVLLLAPLPAAAELVDRLAVETFTGESPRAAADAFERACWRVAEQIDSADPLQELEYGGAHWIRLAVQGPASSVRCLNALEPGRRGIDGTFQWFDRQDGGLVVPAGEPPERVALSVLVDESHLLPPPPTDPKLAAALAQGDAEALAKLRALPEDVALAYVRQMSARGGPAVEAALEGVAHDHPAWRVRREAVGAISVDVALERVAAILAGDEAWEVRLAAAEKVGEAAPMALLAGGGARAQQVAGLLTDRVAHDASWEVRRAAIWVMPTAFVTGNAGALRAALDHDAEPRVRGVALESLVGSGLLDRNEVRRRLNDPAPAVRAVTAAALARDMEASDAPALWRALNDDDRLVRIAASAFLARIDDPTIGPTLWGLYVIEVDEMDADATYLSALLEALARRPFPALPQLIENRLSAPLDPDERRIVARAFGRVAPERSLELFRRLLESTDPFARSVAAEAAPDTPATRTKRLALLQDEDPDVRAAAVLALCRLPGALTPQQAQLVALIPAGLGSLALTVTSQCGAARAEPDRWKTKLALEGEAPDEHTEEAAFWPAVAAIALLLGSVLAIKLAQRTPAAQPKA